MNVFFGNLFSCCKQKRGYFIFLIIATLVAVILGVWIGLSSSGSWYEIDLGNIVYLKFLKNETSFIYLIFGTILSIGIFFGIILVTSCKWFLVPIAVLFYMYMVYSQAMVFMCIIMFYGFFNCIILSLFLLVYLLALFMLFILAMLEMSLLTNCNDYFSCCFNFKKSCLVIDIILLLTLIVAFSIILLILRSYVILLVY